MLSNSSFLEHEVPYRQLEKVGISKKSIRAANKEISSTFMTGGFTPLLHLQVDGNGHTYNFLGKLRLTREPKGGVSLDVLPLRTKTAYDKDLKLDDKELEQLRRGLVLKKNIYVDNKKTTYYAQLDGETNAILKVKARDVAIPSMVKDFDITKQQRETIREGRPVEIGDNDAKYTIGINLLEPTCYKIIQGGKEDWNATVAREWDRITPGEIGFWLTDENGWEYQELLDSNLQNLDLEYQTENDQEWAAKLDKSRSGSIKL